MLDNARDLRFTVRTEIEGLDIHVEFHENPNAVGYASAMLVCVAITINGTIVFEQNDAVYGRVNDEHMQLALERLFMLPAKLMSAQYGQTISPLVPTPEVEGVTS